MAATSSAEAFAVIGNFEASFVDRVWVKARDGQPIADAAVRTVLGRKTVLKQMFIQVSIEGIKVIDSLSYEKEEFVYVLDLCLIQRTFGNVILEISHAWKYHAPS